MANEGMDGWLVGWLADWLTGCVTARQYRICANGGEETGSGC